MTRRPIIAFLGILTALVAMVVATGAFSHPPESAAEQERFRAAEQAGALAHLPATRARFEAARAATLANAVPDSLHAVALASPRTETFVLGGISSLTGPLYRHGPLFDAPSVYRLSQATVVATPASLVLVKTAGATPPARPWALSWLPPADPTARASARAFRYDEIGYAEYHAGPNGAGIFWRSRHDNSAHAIEVPANDARQAAALWAELRHRLPASARTSERRG